MSVNQGEFSHRKMTLAIFFTGGFGRGLSAIQNGKHLAEISSSPTITKVVDEFTLLLFSSIRYIINTTSGEALIRARQPGTDT